MSFSYRRRVDDSFIDTSNSLIGSSRSGAGYECGSGYYEHEGGQKNGVEMLDETPQIFRLSCR